MSDVPNKLLTQNLLQRILSALVLIPLVLAAVWVGNGSYNALIGLVVVAGMVEWLSLTAPKLPLRGKIAAYVGLVLVLAVGLIKGAPQALGLSVLAAALLGYYGGLGEGVSGSQRSRAVWTGLGIPYLTWSALAMISLRGQNENGLALIVYLLLVVWGTDTGAYFAGRIIGGPKLLPKISPKKTWAGLIGGMVFAAAIGYGVAAWFGDSRVVPAALVALILAVVSQAGDFFESYVKRRAGAKDSGKLIPGHGGILDRVDGLLFAAIFLALIVCVVEQG